MRKYAFEELGYFTESACKKIKEKMQGKTFMNFDITYSNFAGNCILIICTDYKEDPQEIKNFFLNCALSSF